MQPARNINIGLESVGLMVSTTLGAGIFALPYVVLKAGWASSLVYFIVFGVILTFIHILYWESLTKIREKDGLVGLIRIYLGRSFSLPGILAIVGGIILTLVIYLILAGSFMNMLAPSLGQSGVILFWFLTSLLFVFRLRWFAVLEFLGGLVIVAMVGAFYGGAAPVNFASWPAVDWNNLFLPFGVILFSLAGWTALEPMYELERKSAWRRRPWLVLITSTLIVVAIYILFSLGVFGSSAVVSADAISGLANWSPALKALLGIFGLFLIWTSYVPMGREAIKALERDMGESKDLSFGLVIFLPLFLYLLGLNDFASAIGLVGGVFLALQYFFISAVAIKALRLRGLRLVLAAFSAGVFLLGVIYEIYYFVLH